MDTGRGIAICLVAVFHTTNWIATTGLDVGLWFHVNSVLSSLRMPTFFVLSGLFAVKWIRGGWRPLLRTKVLLFVWVLAIWSVIGMATQLTGLHAAGQQISFVSAARDLLLSPVRPLFELWFIWALALFFVMARFTRTVPGWVQLVVAAGLSVAAFALWMNTTTGPIGAAKFYFFFLCGVHLRHAITIFAATRWWVNILVVPAWLALSITLYALDLREIPGLYLANCALGVLAGIGLSRALARVTLLKTLGRKTLPIYLAHTPIVVLLSAALLTAGSVVEVLMPISIAIVPMCAGIAVAVSLGLYRAAMASRFRYFYEPVPAAENLMGPRHND